MIENLLNSFDDEYLDCVHDLINHPSVISMKEYTQHGDTDCLQHCLHVSHKSYLICKHLGFDYLSAARGGLLHDFFLYDWHHEKMLYEGFHGLIHPRVALQNANKYFTLNKCEKDIILKHMWPLTIRPPRYREAYVVMAVDKYCAVMEIASMSLKVLKGVVL